MLENNFKTPKSIPNDLEFDIKSIKEELFNKYSHFIGIVFWLVTAPFFLVKIFHQENFIVTIGLLVYVFSFLMIFLSSTLYHSSYVAKWRIKFRILDHVSIYFFIVGTYTPIILIYLNDSFGQLVLLILWLATIFGSIFKLFFVGKFRIISTIIYFLMGWTAVFIIDKVIDIMPSNIFYFIAAGGFIYTFGIIFYINRKIKYNHLIWHIMVLLGAICHFGAIFLSIS